MKRILVVGATGYLGKHLIRELKTQGYWVRALVRNREKLWKRGAFLEPAVGSEVDEVVLAEVTRPQALQGVCQDIDYVFSTLGAPYPHLADWEIDYQANQNLLQAALAYPIEKFILVARQAKNTLGNKGSPQAREQFIRELQASRLTSYILRPTCCFSELIPFLEMARQGKAYVLKDALPPLFPIHGADLAKYLIKAMIAKEKELTLGGPENFSQEEVARLAFKLLDKKPQIRRISGNNPLRVFNRVLNPRRAQAEFFIKRLSHFAGPAAKKGELKLEAYFKEYLESPFFRP